VELKTFRETYLSAAQPPPKAHSWIPGTHGNPKRPARSLCAPA
jgi:hypothetical protein